MERARIQWRRLGGRKAEAMAWQLPEHVMVPPQLLMLPPQYLELPPHYVVLPPQYLPRNVPLGGYIFFCSNETMQDCLQRQLFGLAYCFRDSVKAIRPGTPLFLYNISTLLLHGVFEAVSSGGINIDPSAWPDPNFPGASCYPAQVRVRWRKQCPPLNELFFTPILEHFAVNRFRHELTVHEFRCILEQFELFHHYSRILPRGRRAESAIDLLNELGEYQWFL